MTYSIVGADAAAREVGGAGTSCLTGDDVYVIYSGVPGHGVVHAQATYDTAARDRAALLLARDQPPVDIITSITSAAFDPMSQIRQYGIVDQQGHVAGFTGSGTRAYADDRQGTFGSFAYSVQGNILTSANVLDHAASAFSAADACDLPERLMRALEGGATGGEGDSRCTPRGIPSDSAFLQVEHEGYAAGAYLSLRVRSSGSTSPLPELRAQLDTWRKGHPCPAQAAEPSSGCSCRIDSSASASPLAITLLCGLLIVAWRRKRAPRQLFPAHAP